MTLPEELTESIAAGAGIEFWCHMVAGQEIPLTAPPPQVVPLRYYRAEMNDYRLLHGIPKTPPVLDCAVPVYVSLLGEAGVPDLTRTDPKDIDTFATIRWLATGETVATNEDGDLFWNNFSSNPDGQQLSWSSYDVFTPALVDDYGYLIPKNTTEQEWIQRPALVFDALFANHMSTQVSFGPVTGEPTIEWWLVLMTHPFNPGQDHHSILDIGNQVTGFSDMPFPVTDTLAGRQMSVHRHPDVIEAHQDQSDTDPDGVADFTVDATQMNVTGRPILIRVVFGNNPMIQVYGPRGFFGSRGVKPQQPRNLSTNFVLGRPYGWVDPAQAAGMHLFEVNFYDHTMDPTVDMTPDDRAALLKQRDAALQGLLAAYGINA
jgi:hypothetical protein